MEVKKCPICGFVVSNEHVNDDHERCRQLEEGIEQVQEALYGLELASADAYRLLRARIIERTDVRWIHRYRQEEELKREQYLREAARRHQEELERIDEERQRQEELAEERFRKWKVEQGFAMSEESGP